MKNETVLTDENKTKVCYIEDISKLFKLIGHAPISVKDFDKLYELDEDDLNSLYANLSSDFEMSQISV